MFPVHPAIVIARGADAKSTTATATWPTPDPPMTAPDPVLRSGRPGGNRGFDAVGELLGGLAAGRMAKAGFAKGQVYGQQLKGALSTPKVAPVPVAACEGGACPCSFVAATLVDTDSGQKPIEEVQLGERIGPQSSQGDLIKMNQA